MDKDSYINRAIECLEAAQHAKTGAEYRRWLQEALTFRDLATIASNRPPHDVEEWSPPTSPDLTDVC